MNDERGRGRVSLDVDTRLFSPSAVKKTAYKFGDRFFVDLSSPTAESMRVILEPKVPTACADNVEGEFRNELLDQDLRERVLEETAGVRNLLLAQAFSQTSLIDPVGETGSYEDDPMKIRQSENS